MKSVNSFLPIALTLFSTFFAANSFASSFSMPAPHPVHCSTGDAETFQLEAETSEKYNYEKNTLFDGAKIKSLIMDGRKISVVEMPQEAIEMANAKTPTATQIKNIEYVPSETYDSSVFRIDVQTCNYYSTGKFQVLCGTESYEVLCSVDR